MTTRPERSAELLAILEELATESDKYPSWEDASDLARLHMQALAQDVAGGIDVVASRGQIRLSGLGVQGHTVDLTSAGDLLARWQALVTSTGAAIEGNKSTYNLPYDLHRRTQLVLAASPGPGSVILEFVPKIDEVQERYPGGQLSTDQPQALVQKSVNAAMDILELAATDSLNVTAQFTEWGPRVASKALELAELAASSKLNLELTWEETNQGRRRTSATAGQFAQFATTLKAENLDTEPQELRGVLRTISDRKKIDLEIDDADSPPNRRVIAISRGKVDFSDFRIGDEVIVAATARLTSKPGGQEGRSFTAESVAAVSGT